MSYLYRFFFGRLIPPLPHPSSARDAVVVGSFGYIAYIHTFTPAVYYATHFLWGDAAIDQLDPAAAATLAYAFAKFGIAHDTVLAAATRMAADPARPLRPQTLLQLAQAFAQVGRSKQGTAPPFALHLWTVPKRCGRHSIFPRSIVLRDRHCILKKVYPPLSVSSVSFGGTLWQQAPPRDADCVGYPNRQRRTGTFRNIPEYLESEFQAGQCIV